MDDLAVGGALALKVEGDLHGGDAAPGTANISADTAALQVDGSIGESGDPLETAIGNLSADAEDVDIHSIHDTTIEKITGHDVNIGVDGEIYAGDEPINVISDNLTLDTTGGIAEEDKPLYVYIPGELNVNNHTDDAYVINLYQKGGGSGGDTGYPGAKEAEDWSSFFGDGDVLFRRDWSGAPALLKELKPDGSFLRDVDDRRLALRGALPEDFGAGRILGIFALDDSLQALTASFRYLLLSAETRQLLLEKGVRWIVFRVGDTVMLIDLSLLEETGDYVFFLNPLGEDGAELAGVFHEGEELLHWTEEGSAVGTEEA